MKNQRQNLIMQIVKDENIGTQEELREALKRHGLKVTQATVSRDIKELSLVKTIGSDGNYKYSLPALKKDIAEQNNGIFGIISDAVVSVDHALNTVVVKCHTGIAVKYLYMTFRSHEYLIVVLSMDSYKRFSDSFKYGNVNRSRVDSCNASTI